MASYAEVSYRGTLTTSSVTVLTIAGSTTFIMKGWWFSNSNADDKMVEFLIDDKRYITYDLDIKAGDTFESTPNMEQYITTGLTIKLKREVANDMDYHIWGVNKT